MGNGIKLRQMLHSAAALAAMGAALPAYAQDAPGASDDEIVVTAQRREQRLIDVPASVAAVDAETIRDLSIQQLSEISNHVPNLAIDASVSLNSAVYIRGVGANSRNIGFDTRVGVYLDGVYLGQSPALNQEIVDLERVEVLRGPQGALFGKNTVAGAINLISRQPSFEREFFLSGRAGDFEDHQAMVRWNQPLGENVAAKLSLNYATRDGFTINVFNGDTVGDRNVFSWRAQTRWDVSDDLQILASLDGLRAREAGEYGNAFTNTFGTALSTGYANPRTANLNHDNRDERDVYGGAIEANYSFANDTVVKSITSYRTTEFFSTNDLDYSTLDLLTIDFEDAYDQWTQEFQLISPSGGRFEYVAGLYLYAQDSETFRTARAHSLAPLLGIANGATLDTSGTVETRNIAFYGNGEFDLTDRLTLGAGFRYSWEEKTVDYTIDSSQFAVLGLADGNFQDTRTDRVFSPTLTASYTLAPNLVAFARYAEGYKSGGYNLDFVGASSFPGGLEFDEETARSVEAGIKGDLLDRELNFSLTAFHTTFEDYQVDQFQDMGGGVIAIVIGNASEVESQGAEFEANWAPTETLSFNLGLGYQDV
ncbi:MAG TPA: TonB-dependent receptor, partial [Verrucomicrobiae bacterium]|nr:TonB-dependent receptor [Verrucomicrobiae bacterium]